MNKRQSEILKALYKKQDFMTFAEIAEEEKVSVKTIRNDIGAIKDILSERNCGTIETKPHIGVRLIITDEEWADLNGENDDEEQEIFFFIIRHLLKNGDLTAQRLAQQYYIGRTQLDKILDRVSNWFSENHILFERRRGKGISIRYSEFNYRLALLNFYSEFNEMYTNLISERESKYAIASAKEYTAMCAALDGFDADSVAKIITKTEQEFGLSFNYVSGVSLLFLVSLSIVRNRAGHEVEMPKLSKCRAEGKSDFEIANSIIKQLEVELNIKISNQESDYIRFAIAISEIQEFNTEEARRKFEALNFELCRLTVKAVNLISEIAGINLREDRFFVKQMFLQMKSIISRLRYGVIFKNQLLGQIKTKYPNMMAVAWFLGNIFEKELKLEINEHEVGYLALHIGGAIERQMAGFTACIVCDYGVGISQILKEKITRIIPEIRITSIFSSRDIRRIKNEPCDFVISTTSLEGYRINREILVIGHFLNDRDINLLENQIKKLRINKKNTVKNIILNTRLFNRDLIFPQAAFKDKNELLGLICSRLEALGYVTKSFEKSVREREKSMSTDIGKGFAIPHGNSKYVNHSVAVFVSLEKPIEWTKGGESVDMIFLLAFDLGEDVAVKEEIIRFYKSIVTFMEDDYECNKLRSLTDADEIIRIFELW